MICLDEVRASDGCQHLDAKAPNAGDVFMLPFFVVTFRRISLGRPTTTRRLVLRHNRLSVSMLQSKKEELLGGVSQRSVVRCCHCYGPMIYGGASGRTFDCYFVRRTK